MIRNYMRTFFPKLVDILFILSFIGIFISALIYAMTMRGFGIGTSVGIFLMTIVIGTVGVTLAFGGIYLLLDIRDSLQGRKE